MLNNTFLGQRMAKAAARDRCQEQKLKRKATAKTKRQIKIMTTKEQVLQACTVHGQIVKLPAGQLERKLYMEVAKALELIGGKWKGNKIMGFIFPQDPTELLEQIANGEKRNLKKEFQFFGTPDHLADTIINHANIYSENLSVLEPSAGQGALVKAALRMQPDLYIHGYELMNINRIFLEKIMNFLLLGEDFLTAQTQNGLFGSFDRVIANPPFSKNQDIDHIYKMYIFCKKGGRIVTVASKHWQYAGEKKCTQFKAWLDKVNAMIIDIDAGEFKESGTNVATCMIIIDK